MSKFIRTTKSDGTIEYLNLHYISQVIYRPETKDLEITLGDPNGQSRSFVIKDQEEVRTIRQIIERA